VWHLPSRDKGFKGNLKGRGFLESPFLFYIIPLPCIFATTLNQTDGIPKPFTKRNKKVWKADNAS
jgi:hypothetical protein